MTLKTSIKAKVYSLWNRCPSAAFVAPWLALTVVWMGSATLRATQTVGATRTVWDGVYTAAQATRGDAQYTVSCSRCHDLSGNRALTGERFMQSWIEGDVQNLFTMIKTRMPNDNRGSLSDAAYLDVVAFILRENGFPSGDEELKQVELGRIALVGKNGPTSLPSRALVQVVGCLVRHADTAWVLVKASDPVRTWDPIGGDPTIATRALAEQTFALLDVGSHKPDAKIGHKVEARGFLVRRQNQHDDLSLTNLQSVASSCPS